MGGYSKGAHVALSDEMTLRRPTVAAAAFSISIFGFLTAADAQTDGQFRGQTATVYIAILSAAATILRLVAFASPRPSFVLAILPWSLPT